MFLQSGCLLQQSYSIRGCLREDLMGRNAGRIFSGYRNCDWKPVVIKLVRDVEELRLQRLCAHPGVVEVIAAYRDPRIKGRVYRRSIAVVLEFCGQGDLLDLVSGSPGGVLPAETVRDVAKQCLETLAHLHSLGCCHRDIKPDNVFLSRMADGRLRTKLGDFEFATDEADITKSLHTLQYMAPEVYDNYQNHRLTYTNACDVWSLGATLYVSICGHFPFKFSGKTIATLTDTDVGTLRAGKVRFSGPFWDNVAPDLKALVSAMMTPDANERPTAEECLRRMSEAARNSDGTF